MMSLTELATPSLLLDIDRFERNCERMRSRARALKADLRPHLKTAKSAAVARRALAGLEPRITVSTLREADYFARESYRDILYATAIVPKKFRQAADIRARTGCDLLLVADCIDVVVEAARFAAAREVVLPFLIEVDCGEHRSGLLPHDPQIVAIARVIAESGTLKLRGVMTHAGHSYRSNQVSDVIAIAEAERKAAVDAANMIRNAGIPCEIVSVGSTPTALHGERFEGVTELRAGIYMFFDLAQLSRRMCALDEIAVSVLASVIGHNLASGSIIVDAGALALSKDTGANAFLPDAGFGYVCDPATQARLGTLSVSAVHQEHGTIAVPDAGWFSRLPVGSLVRILPNHACITCAAYDAFNIVRGETVVDRWHRINGW